MPERPGECDRDGEEKGTALARFALHPPLQPEAGLTPRLRPDDKPDGANDE